MSSNDSESNDTQSSERSGRDVRLPGLLGKHPILTLAAAISASFIAGTQAVIYLSDLKLESDRRSVEITLSIADYWESTLDPETRQDLGRFVTYQAELLSKIDDLKSWQTFIVDEHKGNDLDAIRKNEVLASYLGYNGKQQITAAPDHEILKRVSRHRTSLIRIVNVLEAVASLRHYSKSFTTRDIIDRRYKNIICIRTHDLKPFIDEYRRLKNNMAWKILTEMTEKGGEWFDTYEKVKLKKAE